MRITVDRQSGVPIIRVVGELNEQTSPNAKREIESLTSGERGYVLDLQSVPSISAAGVNVVRATAAQRRTVSVTGLSPSVRNALSQANVLGSINVQSSSTDGVTQVRAQLTNI